MADLSTSPVDRSFFSTQPLPSSLASKWRKSSLSALACALLTLLGAAGESLGMERDLKANTAKKRTYSLFRQGCM